MRRLIGQMRLERGGSIRIVRLMSQYPQHNRPNIAQRVNTPVGPLKAYNGLAHTFT